MAADETRPAGINNEPGVATAECAEPTVDTSHTADQTLQCCSQPLLQITRETPYSHYPESENTHCSTLLQRERRVHWGLSFRRQLASELRCEAAALFYFRDQTESRELMTSALSTDQSSGHCLLLHHLTHHPTIIIIQHLPFGKHAITKLGHKMTESHQPIKTSTAVLKDKTEWF